MTRLDDLYALRNRITDEIYDELARLKRIQTLAAQVEVPADEEPDVTGRGNGKRRTGRPPAIDIYTADEAREYHRRYVAGEQDDPDVLAGERQYQRQHKRRKRKEVA